MKMKNFGLVMLAVFGLFSCKQEDLMTYTEQARVYFNLNRDGLNTPRPGSYANNILVDFAPKNSKITTDTLNVGIRVSGSTSDVERLFSWKRNESASDAMEGVDYKILNEKLAIAAGKSDTTIKIVVLRNAGLKKAIHTVVYDLLENENFALGPLADTTVAPFRKVVSLKIRAKDMLIKPANWDSFISTYFGVYSEVKYRFVIDVLAKMDFPSNSSASSMRNNRTKLQNELTKYNNTNPPLKDENDNLVTF